MTDQPQQPTPPNYGAPAAPMTPGQERNWGAATHAISAAAMVLSAGTVGFVASLIIYFTQRDRGPFVRAHAANAVNVQLTSLIGLVICGALFWLIFPLFIYGLIVVAAAVIHVIAATKAYAGEWYNPPFTIPFVK